MLSRRAFLAGSASLGAVSTPTAITGWEAVAEMPVKRSETPAVAHRGKIYIAGGFDGGKQADRYDPSTDTWERLADVPEATNHPGLTVWNDQVVIAGGYTLDASAAFTDMWAYDEATDSWSVIGELPLAMGAFGLAAINQDLYIVGGAAGHLGGEVVDAVWTKASVDSDWNPCAPLTVPREHLAVVAHGGRIYAIGGRAHGHDSDVLGAAVERYDPASDRWEKLPDLPHPRSGLAGTASADGVIVAGGETSAVFDEVQFLSESATSWFSMPDLPVALHGAGLAFLDHHLYVLGGSRIAGQVASVSTTYRYAPGFV